MGLAIIATGFVFKEPGFAWMGVSIVLLGVIVASSIKIAHLIHLMKKAGLWDPAMPGKNKTVITKDFEKHDEKSASELIAEKRAEIINGDEDLEQRKKEVNDY
jgi:hypothetical protein